MNTSKTEMGRKAATVSSQKLPPPAAATASNNDLIFGSVVDVLPDISTAGSSSSSSSSSVNKKKRTAAEMNAGEDGEKVKRPPRVDYREPGAKARLQAAIDGVTMQVKFFISHIYTVLEYFTRIFKYSNNNIY